MTVLALKRSTNAVSYQPNNGGTTLTTNTTGLTNYTVGVRFTVTAPMTLTKVGWARTLPQGAVKKVALWQAGGQELSYAVINAGANGELVPPVDLVPGGVYTLGVLVGESVPSTLDPSGPNLAVQPWSDATVAARTPVPSPIQIITACYGGGTTPSSGDGTTGGGAPPNSGDGGGVFG